MAETERKGGLLRRAQEMLSEMTPKFTVWAKRNGFKRCGIFEPVSTSAGEFYVMTESFGFNAKTIANAVARKEFWDGKIAKSFDWQCFSDTFNEVEPYRCLFGSDIRKDISSIAFLPFNDKENPCIFMAAEIEDEEESLERPSASECCSVLKNILNVKGNQPGLVEKLEANIDAGLEISSANLFILSLQTAISHAISDMNFPSEVKEVHDAVSKSIADAAHVVIEPLFRKPNCSNVGTNGEIKVVMFAKDEQDEQIIAYHVASTLTSLLGADAMKTVLLLTAGICPNKKGTLAFLLHG